MKKDSSATPYSHLRRENEHDLSSYSFPPSKSSHSPKKPSTSCHTSKSPSPMSSSGKNPKDTRKRNSTPITWNGLHLETSQGRECLFATASTKRRRRSFPTLDSNIKSSYRPSFLRKRSISPSPGSCSPILSSTTSSTSNSQKNDISPRNSREEHVSPKTSSAPIKEENNPIQAMSLDEKRTSSSPIATRTNNGNEYIEEPFKHCKRKDPSMKNIMPRLSLHPSSFSADNRDHPSHRLPNDKIMNRRYNHHYNTIESYFNNINNINNNNNSLKYQFYYNNHQSNDPQHKISINSLLN